MVIGVLQFELLIPGSQSLKDKRRVVKSIKDRLHREHLVSVAEIAALDHHRLAVLGLCIVSNSTAYANSVLDAVLAKVRAVHDARLGDVHREIMAGDDLTGAGADVWSESERRTIDDAQAGSRRLGAEEHAA